MKSILLLLLSTGIALSAVAQDPHRHRDTMTLAAYQQEIMRIPVLRGGSQPIIVIPNRQPLCFDKWVLVKQTINSRLIQQTMYMNTKDGYIGVLPPASGTPVEDIQPDQPGFNFSIIGMKGTVYLYKTQKGKNDVLEHWVTTNNTQTYQYQTNTPSATNIDLIRKNETRSYCGGKITAQAYRYDNGANTWYIYGARYPEKIHPIPGKYIGLGGIGYFATQEGVFLILERTTGSLNVQIGDMETVQQCFDPTQFKIKEDAFQEKGQADIRAERERLNRQAGQTSGDCASAKMELINYQQQLQTKKEEALRKAKQGNTVQNTEAARAVLSLMDPIENVRIAILNEKVSICNCRSALSHHFDPSTAEKLNCHNDLLVVLTNLESQMQALDRQYADQPARANAEKSKLYLATTQAHPSCN